MKLKLYITTVSLYINLYFHHFQDLHIIVLRWRKRQLLGHKHCGWSSKQKWTDLLCTHIAIKPTLHKFSPFCSKILDLASNFPPPRKESCVLGCVCKIKKKREKKGGGIMEVNSLQKWVLLWCIVLFISSGLVHCDVTYDRKAIVINGQRRLLFSGSIHYPRSTPEVLQFLPIYALFFLFTVKVFMKWALKCGFVDVGRSDKQGKRRGFGCGWDLCLLECSWAFSWQCTSFLSYFCSN